MNRLFFTFLIISFSYPPDQSGTTTRTMNFIKGLKKAGMVLYVIAPFPRVENGAYFEHSSNSLYYVEKDEFAKIIRVWVPQLPKKGFISRLILYLSFTLSSIFALSYVKGIDYVWAADPNIFSVYSGFFFKTLFKAKLLQNVNDLWPEEVYNLGMIESGCLYGIARSFAKYAYHLSDVITVTSPAYSTFISYYYGINKSKFYFLPIGIDNNCVIDPNLIKSKTFIVMYIGTLSSAYDFQLILNSAKHLEKYAKIKFLIVGKGDESHYISSEIEKRHLSNVIFINKFYPRSSMLYLLNTASVVLLPLKLHNYLGISTKLYEYQALSKPIIVASGGMPSLYVEKTNSGISIEAGDCRQLAKSVLDCYFDPGYLNKMGLEGCNFVNTYCNVDYVANRFIKYLTTRE
jgi:glycosyltransferase involved in cell wall biosynthesis